MKFNKKNLYIGMLGYAITFVILITFLTYHINNWLAIIMMLAMTSLICCMAIVFYPFYSQIDEEVFT